MFLIITKRINEKHLFFVAALSVVERKDDLNKQ